MLYTPHFLIGSAITKLVPNPLIGLSLAFASHFILDFVPHNDFDLRPGVTIKEMLSYPAKRKLFIFGTMVLDGLLMISCLLWLFVRSGNPWYQIAGGLVGISPDLFEQILMILGVPLLGFQNQLQWRVSAKYGFISYPIVCLIALFIL